MGTFVQLKIIYVGGFVTRDCVNSNVRLLSIRVIVKYCDNVAYHDKVIVALTIVNILNVIVYDD